MITDERLYRRYVNGDDDGLNGLMERYGDSLRQKIEKEGIFSAE